MNPRLSLLQVLESAWSQLVEQVHKAKDLDEVVSGHRAFLHSVILRCLLDTNSRQLNCQLRAICDVIINFSQLHLDLVDRTSEELDRREDYQRQVCSPSFFFLCFVYFVFLRLWGG